MQGKLKFARFFKEMSFVKMYLFIILIFYCSLVVKNSKRSDAGQYRLQLRNASGYDTATCNVRVLDRPSPPQNLRADEFAGDALTLFWNPPKDNGGADVTNYVIEKKEPRSFEWIKVI